MGADIDFFKELATSEEMNDLQMIIDTLIKKYPDNKDDVLDFLMGSLGATYENPARAVFQAETMKFLALTRNIAGGVMPHLGELMRFFGSIGKGGKPEK